MQVGAFFDLFLKEYELFPKLFSVLLGAINSSVSMKDEGFFVRIREFDWSRWLLITI